MKKILSFIIAAMILCSCGAPSEKTIASRKTMAETYTSVRMNGVSPSRVFYGGPSGVEVVGYEYIINDTCIFMNHRGGVNVIIKSHE